MQVGLPQSRQDHRDKFGILSAKAFAKMRFMSTAQMGLCLAVHFLKNRDKIYSAVRDSQTCLVFIGRERLREIGL